MYKRTTRKAKVIDNDRWLTKNFEWIVDKYAGGFIFVVNGKIVYTDKDGTVSDLARRVRAEFPGITPLFLRVPYPHEFICALISR